MEPERNNPNQKPPSNPNGDNNKPKTNGWVALTIAILVVLAFSTIFNAVSTASTPRPPGLTSGTPSPPTTSARWRSATTVWCT